MKQVILNRSYPTRNLMLKKGDPRIFACTLGGLCTIYVPEEYETKRGKWYQSILNWSAMVLFI